MTDLPPGTWSALLVGHQWPHRSSLAILQSASTQRQLGGDTTDSYADVLRSIQLGSLAVQEGATAENNRAIFSRGEDVSRTIAEKLRTKGRSYDQAARSVDSLRDALSDIASSGNAAIDEVMNSEATADMKVPVIVRIVSQANADADLKAALCAETIFSAIQSVLDADDGSTSARAFTAAHGIDFGRQQLSATLTDRVAEKLAVPNSVDQQAIENPMPVQPDSDDPGAVTEPTTGPVGAASTAPASSATQSPAGPATPTAAEPTAAEPPTAFTGRENRAAVIESLATALTDPIRAAEPATSDAAPADVGPPEVGNGTAPSTVPGQAPIATTHFASAPTAAPAVVATASTPTAIGAIAPTSSTASQGALPAYGADLRPKMATPAPVATLIPAAPTSTTMSSSAPTGQPGLVRQHTAAATAAQTTSAPGRAERAFAPPSPSPMNRLRRLLDSVTRQMPELRWAVGDLADHTTVLVSDLAGGWIPPQVEIPAEVLLLHPGFHGDDLAALLGEAQLVATHEPGRPPANIREAAEPVSMSIRARETPPVNDLGWELAQATKWRDGLPRLAHTLTRAAFGETGVLDSEVRLLAAHLTAAARAVLDSYPERVDPIQIGNWQLLATIHDLVRCETISAHYHFAWFRAQNPSSGERT